MIPHKLRPGILKELHESHQGIVRMKQWAQPYRRVCSTCQVCLSSHHQEPIVFKPVPERPFQELAVNFCFYAGNEFLIMVDCFTDWPDIIHTGRNTTTSRLIAALKQAFCRSGVPDVVWSDQGPQFSSRLFQDFKSDRVGLPRFLIMVDYFTDWPDIIHTGRNTTTPRLIAALKQAFCRSGVPDVLWSDQGPQFSSRLFQDFKSEWGFQHTTSSPRYPQSNGLGEQRPA